MKFLLSLISRIVGSGLVVAAATPVAQEVYVKSSNSGVSDAFGSAVAISGDTMVVGAPNECSNAAGVNGNQTSESALQAGAAYVFVRNGNTWTQQAYLKASNTGAYDSFGWSVAISGDTIVVGAHLEDSDSTTVNGSGSNNNAANAGAAYVFTRSGVAWTQQAYLKASNAEPADLFGVAVAVSGDTVVVGASREGSSATGVNGDGANNGSFSSGAAYVFLRNGANWTEQAYLKASNPGGGDAFGKSLSLDGDTLVVGAAGEDSSATGVDGNQASNSASGAGAAYVFSRSVGQWWQIGYLKASNTEASDAFGGAVAISADTVVAGAARESGGARGVNGLQNGNGALNSGAAYGFVIPPPDAPEIVVEPSAAAELLDGAGLVTMAPSATGMVMSRSLIVRNTGSGPLVVSGLAMTGANAGSFTYNAGTLPLSVLPGASAVVNIQFQGVTAGSYSATVQLLSNDADESPFDIALSASAVTAASLYNSWTSAAGLVGLPAGHDATPYNDGVANLLKYAFNLNGGNSDLRTLTAGGGLAGLPVFSVAGSGAQAVFRVEFLRRKGSGIIYTPKTSSTLAAASFTPMTGTTTVTDLGSQWERVRLDQPRNPATQPRGFGIVEVTLP
jgi:hypothetical protein